MESKAKKGGNGYPKPFKEQLVELYKTGSRASELAQELGCHESSIVDWAKQMERQAVGAGVDAGKPLNVNEREELIELRKRLRQVQMERDILAKATAWFAGKSEKTFIGSTG